MHVAPVCRTKKRRSNVRAEMFIRLRIAYILNLVSRWPVTRFRPICFNIRHSLKIFYCTGIYLFKTAFSLYLLRFVDIYCFCCYLFISEVYIVILPEDNPVARRRPRIWGSAGCDLLCKSCRVGLRKVCRCRR